MQDATPVDNSYGGLFFNDSITNRTGATSNSYGVRSEIQIASTSAFTNLFAGHFSIDSKAAYTATNSYLLYLDYSGTSLATNTYAIYSVDDVKSYHRGNFGINTNNPQYNLHVVGNARVTGAYIDTLNNPGTAGQVLSSTITGTSWVDASGGGGSGTIGGSTTATEIAFGSSTASEIDSSPGLTYTTQGGLLVKNTAGGGSSKITMRKGTSGNCLFEMQEENPIGTYSAKFFVDLNTSEDTEITATGNLTLQNKVGTTKDIILNPTANLGIGTTTPESKLQVAGGIQMGTDGAADDIAAKAGTLRYREVNGSNPTPKANYSYIDMYMRTGSSSYEWVNIVTNNW